MGMGMPGWVMRLMVGEMADELLLTGQRVMPTKLLSTGYEFRFGELRRCCRPRGSIDGNLSPITALPVVIERVLHIDLAFELLER